MYLPKGKVQALRPTLTKRKLISLLDFVEMRGEFAINEQKILDFNKTFKIVKDAEEIEKLKQELTKLSGLNPGD